MSQELCFWCLGELCSHKPTSDRGMRHPDRDNQVPAVTAYMGTPCCALCAIDRAKKIAVQLRDQLQAATEMLDHIASGDDYAPPAKMARWRTALKETRTP